MIFKKIILLGNGCVVNLPELVEEIQKNESRGVTNWSKRLLISDRAHLGIKTNYLYLIKINCF